MDIIDINDTILKYIEKSINDNELEFEFVYKGKLSIEQFKKLISYCNKNYNNYGSFNTLDIKIKDENDLRITLKDIVSIKKYCKVEELQEIMDIEYMLKKRNLDTNNKPMIIINNDYNYRINVKRETILDSEDYRVTDLKDEWKSSQKFFRYKKRYSYLTDDKLFRIDLTAIKANKYVKELNNYEFSKTFKGSNLLNNLENYELEIEYVGESINEYIEHYALEKGAKFSKDKDNSYVSPEINHIKHKQSEKSKISKNIKYETIKKPSELKGIEFIKDDWVPDVYMVLKNRRYTMEMKPKKNSIPEYQLKILKAYILNTQSIEITKNMSESFGLGTIKKIKPSLEYIDNSYVLEYEVIKKEEENIIDNKELLKSILQLLNDNIIDLYKQIYNTNILLSKTDRDDILDDYFKLTNQLHVKNEYRRLMVPQPVTITKDNVNINVQGSIISNYLVTEKADGDRYILFVNKLNNGYLINSKFEIIDIGIEFSEVQGECILDGEYITKDKDKKPIHLFMIFDIYLYNDEPVYKLPFISKNNSRQLLLQEFETIVKNCEYKTDTNKLLIGFKEYKKGYTKVENEDSPHFKRNFIIFEESRKLLNRDYIYRVDGLIYLPAHLPVSANLDGSITKQLSDAWIHNYKWKPPEENTIDFQLVIKKEIYKGKKRDKIFIYNNEEVDYKYKQCILKSKYNINHDDVTNFCEKMLEPKKSDIPKMIQFNPDVSDNYGEKINVGITNILLDNDKMICENGDEIKDGHIVEMRYIENAENNMVWKPLRVRSDKITPNRFDVANKIWNTIINPITREMIEGNIDITTTLGLSEDYYVSESESVTSEPLKKLHNFIKAKLIGGVGKSIKGSIQIMDTSIGQGGDLSKYMNPEIGTKFIFGLDKSNVNEACKRFYRMNNKKLDGIFIQYDTSKNIINQEGLDWQSNNENTILNILYGVKGEIDPKYKTLKKILDKKALRKFDIISCQFSLHYYFENMETLKSYLTNVEENCKTGGYFIGCCYDGMKVFDKLKDKESLEYKTNDQHIVYNITKKYKIDDFEYNDNDDKMVGQQIDVEMESIGQTIPEYLVNFDFLEKIMLEYGFKPVKPELSSKYKEIITSSIGSFETIIDKLEDLNDIELNKFYKESIKILENEKLKELSSLNNYFIFQKIKE